MRNAMWVGGGITGMGEIPMLGTPVKGITALIKKIFYSGAQGFAYDPNDLTAEKIKWRRNVLKYSENFLNSAWTGMSINVIKEDVGYRITNVNSGGYLQQHLPAEFTSEVNTITAVFKSASTGYARAAIVSVTAGANGAGVLANMATGEVSPFVGGTGYAVKSVSSEVLADGNLKVVATVLCRKEQHRALYSVHNSDGTATVAGSNFTLISTQVENSAEASAYQPITDFNSDFIKKFPLHALYQDAAGTIPVTGAGQPVGLILDKSKGLVLGEELASVTEVVSLPIDSVGGVKTYLIGAADVGKTYQITFTVSNFTGSGDVGIAGPTTQWLDGTSVSISSNGTTRSIRTKLATSAIFLYTCNTAACVFSNISIKEIKGNHAYQTVSASRPILQQTPKYSADIVPKPIDFNKASWSLLGAGTSAVSNSFTVTGSVGAGPVFRDLKVSKSYTAEVEWTATVPVTIEFLNAPSSAGTKLHQSNTGKAVFSFKAADPNLYFRVPPFSGPSTITVTKVTIKEAIGYRTDQNYLEFDGSDDFLQTNNIDFTATDKVSLFAGVRKLNDAAAMIVELSGAVTSNNGTFYLARSRPIGASEISYSFATKGTLAVYSIVDGFAAPHSAVLTANGDIRNDVNNFGVNGMLGSSTGDQGTGNYGNYPLYIGKRGSTSLPFNGHLYGLIGIGKLTSDNETAAIERELAKRTGVTLNV